MLCTNKRTNRKENIMTYTELKEIIINWDEKQKEVAHFLLSDGECLDEIIEIIDNYNYRIYENLEDYILSYIEETQDAIPYWVVVDVVRTYNYSLRYNDDLFFMSNLPKWAEGGSQYGTDEEKYKYSEGIKYLCSFSKVLEVYR